MGLNEKLLALNLCGHPMYSTLKTCAENESWECWLDINSVIREAVLIYSAFSWMLALDVFPQRCLWP